MSFGNGFVTGKRGGQTTLSGGLAQERKDLVGALAEDFFAAPPGNPLHSAIPSNDAAVAIKRKKAVDAGVEQAL
jgi:hypothetical protein